MSTPEPFNAADKRQVKERERQEKNSAKQAVIDLRAVLAMPEGRRVIWRLLEHCGLYRSPFNPNAAIAAHNAGLQAAALHLLAEIQQADEKAWLQMQAEHLK